MHLIYETREGRHKYSHQFAIYNSSIMQVINQQIRAFLKNAPSESALTDFINNLVPKITPKVKMHEVDIKTTKEPTLVYARLMVQDIRDPFFYYSFIMKKPFSVDDKFYLFRWGNHPQMHNAEEAIQSNEYMKVMLERDQVQCVPVIGSTAWAKKLQGLVQPIQLFVDGKSDFKLGEVINIVAFYYPDHHKLYFVRKASPEEIAHEKLDPFEALKIAKEENVDHSKTRQELLSFFSGYCSETFAEYLLLCLLSDTPLFLGAEADVSELISLVYPRVKHLKLVYPCQESLFPFKNQEGEMMVAPMQLSNLSTFVSIDLAEFSDKNIVQIGENTINNFKALKVFVEEGNTIYRWEYGQSMVGHTHKGIIVKAASFITPHFYPKDQAISPDFSTLKNIASEVLDKFRSYLIRVASLAPKLEQQQRTKIEQSLKTQQQKAFFGSKLNSIMQLAVLIARSHGRESILFADYQRAKFLVHHQIPQKKQN